MKKGFTLIELLAVIIILAIIALIATPLTLNVIDGAKANAAKSEANLVLKSINSYCAIEAMEIQGGQVAEADKLCKDGALTDLSKMVNTQATVNATLKGGVVETLTVTSNDHTYTLSGAVMVESTAE